MFLALERGRIRLADFGGYRKQALMLDKVDRIVAKIVCTLFVVPVSLGIGLWMQHYPTSPGFASLMLFMSAVSVMAGFACWRLADD